MQNLEAIKKAGGRVVVTLKYIFDKYPEIKELSHEKIAELIGSWREQ